MTPIPKEVVDPATIGTSRRMGKGHPRTEKSLYLKIGVGTIKSSIRIVELAPNSPASRRRTLDFTHSFLHLFGRTLEISSQTTKGVERQEPYFLDPSMGNPLLG